jgi:hypothetical protein
MPTADADEETPLLGSEQAKKKPTPLPWGQFSIVLFLQLAEPLTYQVISPFAPAVCIQSAADYTVAHNYFSQLVRELGVTNGDEAKGENVLS